MAPLRFTIWTSGRIPGGIWDPLSPWYYVSANLWSHATRPTNISMTSTRGRETLLLSIHVSAPLQEFLQMEVTSHPHSFYASGIYNIKCHRYNLFFYIRGWKEVNLTYTVMMVWLLQAAQFFLKAILFLNKSSLLFTIVKTDKAISKPSGKLLSKF